MASFTNVSYVGGKSPASYGVLNPGGAVQRKQPMIAGAVGAAPSLASVMLSGQQVGAAPASQSSGVAGVTAPAPYAGNVPPPPTPAAGSTGIDLSGIDSTIAADPYLAQMRAMTDKQVQDAQSGAASQAQRDLIGYGDFGAGQQNLASLLGSGLDSSLGAVLGDQNTLAAARGNPDSTLAQLASEHLHNNANVDQTDNASNLFYGSKHANDLAGETSAYGARQRTAAGSLADLLGGLNSNIVGARQSAQQQLLTEETAAFQRALQLAQLMGGTAAPAPAPTTGTATPLSPDSLSITGRGRTRTALAPLPGEVAFENQTSGGRGRTYAT